MIDVWNDKWAEQAIGINLFSKMSNLITNFLKINDDDAYTGYCFRILSASLIIAERYVDQSIQNKIDIRNEIAGIKKMEVKK